MTYVIIAITVVISILCFNNPDLFSRLQFNAYQVVHRRQYYRLLTHGFVHAGWWHLFVNMFVLYFFGRNCEAILDHLAGEGIIHFPMLTYLLLYLIAVVFASSISLLRHKDDVWYNSVGASGAVAAVMFFSIFFFPWQMLYLYGVIGLPGIVFALLYIGYEQFQSKKGRDNINHDAHLLGAVFGFVFPLFLDVHLIFTFWA